MIRGVDAQPEAELDRLLLDLGGRVEAHLDALDEFELEGVEAELLDALEAGQLESSAAEKGTPAVPK